MREVSYEHQTGLNSALKAQQTSVLRVRCASFFKRLYIVTVPVLCPNFSMTAFFLVTKKGDSNILKFVMYRKIYIVNFDVPRSCRKRLHF